MWTGVEGFMTSLKANAPPSPICNGVIRPEHLLCPKPAGLYCAPGDFYIDPVRPVERAVITHGHADHARAGHGAVVATPADPGHHALPLRRGLRRRTVGRSPTARPSTATGSR